MRWVWGEPWGFVWGSVWSSALRELAAVIGSWEFVQVVTVTLYNRQRQEWLIGLPLCL
ncbi:MULTISPECIES: hypothetical protein [Pyrobaculum]|uniref:hypothetical protein n=1 Tax=Pyrobaculum TaxID=2276 RepID=UPI001F4CF122|nr:hypothetical protein [Pyrobaculum arsenaticum]MCY0889937.1 hypothetical protein [Pyrobaculum arsenaticum]